jgi:hypothetical protein
MIINLIYCDILHWKIYFDMLVEMVGFEPHILWLLVCSANLWATKAAQQTFLLELYLNCVFVALQGALVVAALSVAPLSVL